MTIIFYIFAALTVLSAVALLWVRQVLYSAFALLFTFLGLAGLYVLAGADFLAVAQIMVYVGGVLVLLIFGIMLTNRQAAGPPVSGRVNRVAGILAAGGLFAVFLTLFLKANLSVLPQVADSQPSSIPAIGAGLMTDFLLPFEICGILLMVALMGAAFIASRKP